MSIPPYQLGYPPDGSSLGQTKTTIRGNLDGTFLTLAVDHINNNGQPGMQPAGYHKAIHMVQQTPPTAVANVGELWCTTANDGYASDTLFFQKTGGNLNAQMSRNFAPVAAANGYTFIPGGLVLQWGTVASVTQNGTTNFNIDFTANVFSLILTPISSANTNHANGVYVVGNPLLNQFSWSQADRATSQTGFYWVAIGN